MSTAATALHRWERRDKRIAKRKYGMRVDDSDRKLAQIKRERVKGQSS